MRMNWLTKEVTYIDLLNEFLTENELFNSPSEIYDADKMGIALDGHAPRDVVK